MFPSHEKEEKGNEGGACVLRVRVQCSVRGVNQEWKVALCCVAEEGKEIMERKKLCCECLVLLEYRRQKERKRRTGNRKVVLRVC